MLDSRIPTICRDSDRKAGQAVNRAGYRIEAGAKIRSRVDTGFMRGELEWIPGPGPHEGQAVGGANYTVHNEFGTRYMAAQPMLVPATEDAREPFYREMHDAYGRS